MLLVTISIFMFIIHENHSSWIIWQKLADHYLLCDALTVLYFIIDGVSKETCYQIYLCSSFYFIDFIVTTPKLSHYIPVIRQHA
jgi:hypothetical protein